MFRDLHRFVMPAWLDQASQNQQFFTLSLPILVAVLVLFAARVLWEEDPSLTVRALLLADQRQLGYRRFTPARRWFSAFTLSLIEAQSVVQNSPSTSDVIDLEELDAESELLADLGGYAESDEVRSLQELVTHFRRELILEAGDEKVPGLSETWVGYGSQRITGIGPLAEAETTLRIFNADDLGYQLIARIVTRGVAAEIGKRRRPIAFVSIGTHEPTPEQIEETVWNLGDARTAGRHRERLLIGLLEAGEERSVQATTSDELIETIQRHSRRVGSRGDARAWTQDCELVRWGQSWSSTTVVSGGPAEQLSQEGPAFKTDLAA